MPDEVIPIDNELLISRLAREIARNLVPLNEICERYKLDEDEYQRILRHPMFKQRLEEELDVWNASTPKAIVERISSKAATMIEESLVEIYNLIHDRGQPMAPKIEALKWAARMAGVGDKDTTGQTLGERVRFNIYIGSEKVSFDKEAADAKLIEGAVVLDGKPL